MMNQLNLKTDNDATDGEIMPKKAAGRTGYTETLAYYHDIGLSFCWKVKEGLKRGIDPERVNRYIDFFWNKHLKSHFKEEEALLFNEVDNDLTQRRKYEHQQLEEWFDRIISSGLKSFKEYFSFTDLLVNHIRFEEKVLFPHFESGTSGKNSEIMGKPITEHEAPFIDNYDDQFWLRHVPEVAK